MKADKNRNVSILFAGIHNIKENDYMEEEQPNYLFENKMGVLREEFGINRNLPINSKTKINKKPETKDDLIIEASVETKMPHSGENTSVLINKDNEIKVDDDEEIIGDRQEVIEEEKSAEIVEDKQEVIEEEKSDEIVEDKQDEIVEDKQDEIIDDKQEVIVEDKQGDMADGDEPENTIEENKVDQDS